MKEGIIVFIGGLAVMAAFHWGLFNLDKLTEHRRRPAPELPLYIYRNVTISIPIAIVIMGLMDLFVFALLPFEYCAVVLLAQGLVIWALIREAQKTIHYPLEHERRSKGIPIMEITELGIRARPRDQGDGVLGPEELFEWNRIRGFELVAYAVPGGRGNWFWIIQITLLDGTKIDIMAAETRRRELLHWLNTYLARFNNLSLVHSTQS